MLRKWFHPAQPGAGGLGISSRRACTILNMSFSSSQDAANPKAELPSMYFLVQPLERALY